MEQVWMWRWWDSYGDAMSAVHTTKWHAHVKDSQHFRCKLMSVHNWFGWNLQCVRWVLLCIWIFKALSVCSHHGHWRSLGQRLWLTGWDLSPVGDKCQKEVSGHTHSARELVVLTKATCKNSGSGISLPRVFNWTCKTGLFRTCDIVHVAVGLPKCRQTWVWFLTPHKPGMVVYTCNFSPQEVALKRQGIGSWLWDWCWPRIHKTLASKTKTEKKKKRKKRKRKERKEKRKQKKEEEKQTPKQN